MISLWRDEAWCEIILRGDHVVGELLLHARGGEETP
jgi:hypothetical protein